METVEHDVKDLKVAIASENFSLARSIIKRVEISDLCALYVGFLSGDRFVSCISTDFATIPQPCLLHDAIKARVQKPFLDHVHAMGFPIDNLDDDGRSLLHVAVLHNRESIIERLLVLKADHSAEDNDGNTPIHLAVQSGALKICKLLVAGGADVNAVGQLGYTSLHLAASKGNDKICQYLADIGAHIDAKGADGKTPLHKAVEIAHYPTCALLCKKKDCREVADNDGNTPLDLAHAANNQSLVYFLSSLTADIGDTGQGRRRSSRSSQSGSSRKIGSGGGDIVAPSSSTSSASSSSTAFRFNSPSPAQQLAASRSSVKASRAFVDSSKTSPELSSLFGRLLLNPQSSPMGARGSIENGGTPSPQHFSKSMNKPFQMSPVPFTADPQTRQHFGPSHSIDTRWNSQDSGTLEVNHSKSYQVVSPDFEFADYTPSMSDPQSVRNGYSASVAPNVAKGRRPDNGGAAKSRPGLSHPRQGFAGASQTMESPISQPPPMSSHHRSLGARSERQDTGIDSVLEQFGRLSTFDVQSDQYGRSSVVRDQRVYVPRQPSVSQSANLSTSLPHSPGERSVNPRYIQHLMELAQSEKSKFLFFASHSWGLNKANHGRVARFVAAFTAVSNVSVWLDETHFRDRFVEIIAGIDESAVFVAFVTQEYIDKIDRGKNSTAVNWCFDEFVYANHHKSNRITLVIMEETLKNGPFKGLVGIFGMNKYVDFTSDDKLDSAVWDLCGIIEAKLSND